MVTQFADEAERLIELGERVIGAVGGADTLMRTGLDRLVAPEIRKRLEAQNRELEQENGYLREVLMALTNDGPLLVHRPTQAGRLTITVDVRNCTIEVKRAT